MGIWVGIFISVAAAALFFFVEPYLLRLDTLWRLVGTAGVFLVSTALAVYLSRKDSASAVGSGSVLSGNEIRRGLKARIEGTELSESPTGRILSGNKIGGDADVDIKNSKL